MTAFVKYTTITGREIKVRPNYSKRHFTIKTECAKWRTYKLSKENFNSLELYTGDDWNNFLKSDDYYRL